MIASPPFPEQDFFLSTGRIRIPVCIGDLPSSDYQVSANTITYDVVKHLRDHEEIPGVRVYAGKELVNVLPRLRMFERLGQLYGTDLFIRKPIESLCQILRTEAFSLPRDLRVNDAIRSALQRRAHNVYDPLVRVSEDKTARLVDMHTLLLVQSQILTNMNKGISNLDRLRRFLSGQIELIDAANLMIDGLNEVVAYHQAAVLLHKDNALHLVAGRGFPLHPARQSPDKLFLQSSLFNTMVRIRQSITVEDVDLVPDWKKITGAEEARCWIGVPLFSGTKVFGLMTFARTARAPFRKDEKDTLDACARLLSDFLEREQVDVEKKFAVPRLQSGCPDRQTERELCHQTTHPCPAYSISIQLETIHGVHRPRRACAQRDFHR